MENQVAIQKYFKPMSALLAVVVFLVFYFLPFPQALDGPAQKTIACACFMIVLWLTEAIPIPATALLPILLFPVLDIVKLETVTASYGNPVVFLFMGGFTLALALEKWNLHQRIAFNIIRLTGTSAKGIILGFMISTAFLSMWISNTATAVIMLPIALSVIQLVHKEGGVKGKFKNFGLALTLIIAYAANIGGMATLIGTPPNVVMKGLLESVYGMEITFSGWLIVGIPVTVLMLAFVYLIVVIWLYPSPMANFSFAAKIVEEGLQSLGPMKKEEKIVSAVFIFTASLWVLRLPINTFLGGDYLTDTGIAIGGSLLLFFIPADIKNKQYLMDWETMTRLPWGILLLFGGGLALAGAMEHTGIIGYIGQQVESYQHLNTLLIIFVLTAIMLFMTELMSNVALCTVFLPMTFGIAEGIGIPVLAATIPVTLASSCAFMLPMGTPPNAIVFAGGHLKIKHMVRAGVLLNILAVIIAVFLSQWLFPFVH